MLYKIVVLLLVAVANSHIRLHHFGRDREARTASEFDKAIITHTATEYVLSTASRTVHLLNVPDVFQATDYTCGPASLSAVLSYYRVSRR
jgi:hypothetical protein